MIRGRQQFVATTFKTRLGWMAILGRDALLSQLTIGNASPAQALASLNHAAIEAVDGVLRTGTWDRQLSTRLQAYADGVRDDFLDVVLEPVDRSDFAERVIQCCRKIPCGATLSYGQLAQRAKAPRAARAVGTVMSTNRIPLIIPCHRVVRSGGGLGGYTSPAGIGLKRQLLQLEAAMRG